MGIITGTEIDVPSIEKRRALVAEAVGRWLGNVPVTVVRAAYAALMATGQPDPAAAVRILGA